MKRGEVWTAAGGANYAGKPRPVLIIQHDRFDATQSVTVCPFTTDPADAPYVRIVVEPDTANGLRQSSRLMVDKITTVSRARLDARVGRVDEEIIAQLNRAVFVFLGLGEPSRSRRKTRAGSRRQLTLGPRGAR
jgi:mRNA interferase MazF